MTHLGYIVSAYAATAIILAGLAVWVALDLRTQKEKLRRLEEQGMRRRSGAKL